MGILRDQAEELPLHQSQPLTLGPALITQSGSDNERKHILTLIPHYLRDFEEVFAKESFDSLPEKYSWDHAIELEPGSKPSACKVYPLAPNKQVQLDTFLQENLSTGRIHPSKSPMV